MERKDEVQQRAESITHLSVSAWHCTTCKALSERRKPQCLVSAMLPNLHALKRACMARESFHFTEYKIRPARISFLLCP
jgi:hypothetical protein